MLKKAPKFTNILKYSVLVIFVIVLVGGYFGRGAIKDWWWRYQQPELPNPVIAVETRRGVSLVEEQKEDREQIDTNSVNSATDVALPSDYSGSSSTSQPRPVAIPTEINLAVPFTSQAPNARWDAFDEEMCEEASLLMVNRFYQNRQFTSKDDQASSLQEIQKWEVNNLPDWKSNSAEEIAQVARKMLGYQSARAVELTDFNQIKEQIAQNNPVILPAAGRELKNPNFKSPGPLYHMLVVRGWLADGRVITNDPGTRRGEGYLYNQSVLWNAIGDWNRGDVANSLKVMIVLK